MSTLQQRIAEFLKKNPGAAGPEIADAVKASAKGVGSALRAMEDAGEVVKTPPSPMTDNRATYALAEPKAAEADRYADDDLDAVEAVDQPTDDYQESAEPEAFLSMALPDGIALRYATPDGAIHATLAAAQDHLKSAEVEVKIARYINQAGIKKPGRGLAASHIRRFLAWDAAQMEAA